jgi:hypothetical protein
LKVISPQIKPGRKPGFFISRLLLFSKSFFTFSAILKVVGEAGLDRRK